MLKKSQTSFEYLSTYGWAMLIALAAIWIIVYFGVLNPQNFMQQKCSFGDKLLCVDYYVNTNGNLIIKLFNSYDENVIVEDARGINLELKECNPVNITGGETGDFYCNLTGNLEKNDRLRLDMILNYRRDLAGSPLHDLSGQIFTKVEAPLPNYDCFSDLSGKALCYFPSTCPPGKIIYSYYGLGACCVDDCIAPPQCADNKDNDGDGAVDWDGGFTSPPKRDCGCTSWDDNSEAGCGPSTCFNYCDEEPPENAEWKNQYHCCDGLCTKPAPDGWCCASNPGATCCLLNGGMKSFCAEDFTIEE